MYDILVFFLAREQYCQNKFSLQLYHLTRDYMWTLYWSVIKIGKILKNVSDFFYNIHVSGLKIVHLLSSIFLFILSYFSN